MRKILWLLMALLIVTGVNVYAQNSDGRYVRKQLQPEFFIPEGQWNPQEKLPPVVKPQPKVPTAAVEESVPQQATEEIPDYQRKYQEYVEDLKKIDAQGTPPANQALQRDLEQMNSNEQFPAGN